MAGQHLFTAPMAAKKPFLARLFSSFIIIFFYLGCLVFPTSTATSSTCPKTKKKRFTSFVRVRGKAIVSTINPWKYVKPILAMAGSIRRRTCSKSTPASPFLEKIEVEAPVTAPTRKRSSPTGSLSGSDWEVETKAAKRPSFAVRSDVFPCLTCGEVLETSNDLELHVSAKHAVSELLSGDSAMNIVSIIFQTSWSGENAPAINRVLKIHPSAKILSRFEEYRESVKAKAAIRRGRWSERCAADGNELLRFHCSTFLCSLAGEICSGEYCGVCGIIRNGFSPKLDGIPMTESSRRAHEAIPADMEEEFRYMRVKRAMLVCRVVAGRVAKEGDLSAVEDYVGDKADGEFDSMLVVGGGRRRRGAAEEELLVYNTTAVLPCFVIVYGDY